MIINEYLVTKYLFKQQEV